MKRSIFIPLIIILVCIAVLVSLKILIKPNSSSNSTSVIRSLIAAGLTSNTVTVDFNNQVATGSPLIFGGAHAPNLEHQDAWNLLASAGVTMIRRDFFIESEVPSNITLDDYKNNKNNVQDPSNWNKSVINDTNSLYKNAQERGLKVMGIVSYAPAWLTYTGKDTGVPKDWQVYEDVVKKLYRLHRPYLDMVEIWNEPNIQEFLDTAGSGLTRAQAYELIFEHAVNAIKSVDAEVNDGRSIPILAPAASNPNNTEIIDYLLSQPISKYIDGVSVHSYGKDEPSWSIYLDVMKKYGRGNLPIYVTEWNKTSDYIKGNEFVTGNVAIPFTGQKLIEFLKGGITGANYFSTTYYNFASQSKYSNSFGFYQLLNGKSQLLPQGRTWQILSKSLSLGVGPSRIYDTNSPDTVDAVGFTNSNSNQGLAIVNQAKAAITINISLENLKIPANSTAKLFIASAADDPKIPFCTEDSTSNLVNPIFSVNIPPESVVGILFSPPKLTFNSLLRVLGVSTSQNCLPGL